MAIQRRDGFIPRKNYLGQINESMIRQELLKNRVQPDLVNAISKSMVSVFRKLAPDERLNYEVIEKAILTPAPSLRAATVIVESSDSVGSGTNGADYTIDTTEDAATKLTLARDMAAGGSVLLLDGTYNLNSELLWTVANQALIGSGPGTSIVTTAGGSIRADNDYQVFTNFSITGGAGINIDDMSHGIIRGCWFRSCTYGTNFATVGTPRFNIIEGNHFVSCTRGIKNDTQFGSSNLIIGNFFYEGTYGIDIDKAAFLQIVDNFFENQGTNAIYIHGSSSGLQIVGNRVYSSGGVGINLALGIGNNPVMYALIDGNYIQNCAGGVADPWSGMEELVVSNNYFRNNTGDAIAVAAEGAYIHGNKVHGTSHTNAIRIYGDNVLCINNDLRGGWTTAAINSTGAGTLYNLDGSANNWNRLA